MAPPTLPDTVEAKRRLRAEAIERRKRLADPSAGPKLAQSVRRLGPFRAGAAVSGFYPMPPEIDVLPTLAWFAGRGHKVALPVVVGRKQPLIFRAWSPGTPIERGGLGIPFPSAESPEIVPEILMVPLLAFDRRGFRLGYGGGYYDRTLADLRARGPVLAIGVGFAFQEVEAVPDAPDDQPVDAIATESGAERVR
ncbi:MAG: 5-formyltetrahydrofolate cyclo-ligase [Alphaproteobacteria bacterium]|nr:5-formyltetrahydrofolate cyclo-ligase [Alphaproteobacteria bacterium]